MASHGRPQINLPSQSSAHEETGEEVQRDFELGRVLLKVSSQRERDAVVLVAGVRATPKPNGTRTETLCSTLQVYVSFTALLKESR